MNTPEPMLAEPVNPATDEDSDFVPPTVGTDSEPRSIHRIGGATVENLRLKPKEETLNPPGISVIKAPSPAVAAAEMRTAFPKAKVLHEHTTVRLYVE